VKGKDKDPVVKEAIEEGNIGALINLVVFDTLIEQQ
jgi:hypothetical protein